MMELMGGLPEKTPLNAKDLGETHVDAGQQESRASGSRRCCTIAAKVPHNGAALSAGFEVAQASWRCREAARDRDGARPRGQRQGGRLPMASTFARNGFAVLSYDPIGQGERLQYPDPTHPKCGPGLAADGRTWRGRPAADADRRCSGAVLCVGRDASGRLSASRAPEIDANRIGAFGCSGGGAMTALLGRWIRVSHAVATACYFTSIDALLPSIGAQDAEQSIPGFIASGWDFPDWLELAAPRPYAMVGTVSDMFPWTGFLTTAKEARRFYSIFDRLRKARRPESRCHRRLPDRL